MKARPQHLLTANAEDAYVRLAGYEFARGYTEGKSVLDVTWEEAGYGPSLLAGSAESVVGLIGSSEDVDLPRLPHPDGSFDVVVAFGVVEHLDSPEELMIEAKRVLKPDGILVISAPDREIYAGGPRKGLYAAEFRELLERSFRDVSACRQGAVTGALTVEDGAQPEALPVASAYFSRTDPAPGEALPTLRYVIAACSDAELAQGTEPPRLLLDLDQRAFEENEDLSEGMELLRDEVQRMQESEAQSFQDTLTLRGSETAYFKAQLQRSESRANALTIQNENLKKKLDQAQNQLREIENSHTWRALGLYRNLRTRMKG